MKKYVGTRKETGECQVWIMTGEQLSGGKIKWTSKILPQRLDLVPHSPTGFEWGYGGSGPAQLAIAILADAFEGLFGKDEGDELALLHYQEFKWKLITKLAHEGWTYPLEELEKFMRKERLT